MDDNRSSLRCICAGCPRGSIRLILWVTTPYACDAFALLVSTGQLVSQHVLKHTVSLGWHLCGAVCCGMVYARTARYPLVLKLSWYTRRMFGVPARKIARNYHASLAHPPSFPSASPQARAAAVGSTPHRPAPAAQHITKPDCAALETLIKNCSE